MVGVDGQRLADGLRGSGNVACLLLGFGLQQQGVDGVKCGAGGLGLEFGNALLQFCGGAQLEGFFKCAQCHGGVAQLFVRPADLCQYRGLEGFAGFTGGFLHGLP